MASRGSQSSIRHFFTSPGSSVSTVSEIEGSKSDEQLDEKLHSDEEVQSSEPSSGGSSDEVDQSAIEDRIGHGEVISDGEILAKRRKIAHHRKGGVSPSWLKEFPWLRSVRGKNGKIGMRCHLCTKHSIVPRSGSTSWTSDPCFCVRKDKVVKHGKSRMHRQAEVMEASLQVGGIPRAFDESYALEMKAAVGCCKCIYWLCKQEVSHTTTYPHLLALAENLGCDYFKALNVGQNAKYTSPQIVAEFLDVINGVVEEEVLSDMKGSSSYSVMVDESTDVSVLKQLVLYGRAVVKGELKTRFLKIIDLSDGKAPTIVDAITTFLQSVGLSIDDLSSFGSDGASVMTGRHRGVAALLRAMNSHIISVHCVCHRLALATGQASNNIKYLRKVKEYLLALWKYFHYSPVRSSHLKCMQQVMASPELKILKAVDTRWLSHKAAVSALLRSLASVFVTLQQEIDPTAVGLRKVLAHYNFFGSLLLLDDVLSAVNRLSLAFQRAAVDLTIISPLLDATLMTLEKLKQEPAADFEARVKQLIARTTTEVNELHHSPEPEHGDESENEGFELVHIRCNEPEQFEVSVRQAFLSNVTTNLQERFPQVDLLESFTIFDPAGLLGQEVLALDRLRKLLDHYNENGPLAIDRDRCISEYTEFSTLIKGHATLSPCQSLQELAQEFLCRGSLCELFPSISKLLVHALVLPVCTADCERCFSTMKRIKTDLRNRMNTATLDKLLRIRIEGPDLLQFNFKEAVRRWKNMKNRRLFSH